MTLDYDYDPLPTGIDLLLAHPAACDRLLDDIENYELVELPKCHQCGEYVKEPGDKFCSDYCEWQHQHQCEREATKDCHARDRRLDR